MPDVLTAEERAAIARAVTSGWLFNGELRQVQIIPRGVSGLPPFDYGKGIDWRTQIKTQWAAAGKLRAPQIERAKTPEEVKAKIKAGLARRRDAIRGPIPPMEMHAGESIVDATVRMEREGRTHREIAKFFGVSHTAIYHRLKRLQEAHKVAAE